MCPLPFCFLGRGSGHFYWIMNLSHWVQTWVYCSYLTGILCLIVLHRYCVFYKLKRCGNFASNKPIGVIFPTAFAHFVSLW